MEYITCSQEGAVATITVNRPEALNALNTQVLGELEQAFDSLDTGVVRCVILTGAGEKAFVAGADIGEMKDFDPESGLAFGRKGNQVLRKIETFPVPVIAAVNGYALGGGCELAMSCDIRICAENAAFAQPETGLGITPGFGGTQRLPRLVGQGLAKELIYTGRRVKAQEAQAVGLVNAVYPQAELLGEAQKLAGKIASCVPYAVRASKAAINQGAQLDLDAALELEAQAFSGCFTTEDRREAMTAFVEKRKPAPFANR